MHQTPPTPAIFAMPMFRPWVPRILQPWIYILTVFCIQFSSGIYLGALESIRGTTGLMIEDLLMLLYASLAGMAIYFPLLFRMKFRFTNQQLLCTSAIIIAICNLITMHSTFMPLLLLTCFISGMAKLQATFECMSNIQLWITPKRDFAVFFPVLHIVLLTSIEGSGWLAAWFAHHFTWQSMHIFTVATMCFVILTQATLCRPFCPLPQRLSLRGIDLSSGLLISLLMLMVSYILVYGDYLQWYASPTINILTAAALILSAYLLHRLRHVAHPFVNLHILTLRNVIPILIVTIFAELLLGCEHTLEEILYCEVYHLEELTKETHYLFALPGIYLGVAIALYWLRLKRWKVWRLFGIAFGCLLAYSLLMYLTIDRHVNIEQYHLPIILRGCAYSILASTLMWSLHESIHDLEQFFMGLFIFNILHMYLAGATGYGFYTTLFSHYLNDDISLYGHQLTLLHIQPTDFGQLLTDRYLPNMFSIALKQVYGLVTWISAILTILFLLLDIPAVRTNLRKVPLWPVTAIEYLTHFRHSI